MSELRSILKKVVGGRLDLQKAERLLKVYNIREIGEMAKFDTNRHARVGIPEIILAENKTPEQMIKMLLRLRSTIILSRLSNANYKKIKKKIKNIRYFSKAKLAVANYKKTKKIGTVGIITAGTSDIPTAEEASVTAQLMGCNVVKVYDVGVAGLHRLFNPLKKMVQKADVIIVAAGREGTLPAIVSGLVNVPVIGLPISTGYGYGAKGEAALKSMLQSCSFLTVVNIDNGVGAGACAAKISRNIRLQYEA